MAIRKYNEELLKRLYAETDGNITEICRIAGCSRPTYYVYYNKHKAEWDKARKLRAEAQLLEAQSLANLETREKKFLALFLTAFEERMDAIKEMSDKEGLDELLKYFNTYRKIVDPKTAIKKDKVSGAEEAIAIITRLAQGECFTPVCEFLSKHADKIVAEVAGIK